MLNSNIVVFWICTWAPTRGGGILPPLLEKQQHASPIRLHDDVTQDENLHCCKYLEYYADKRDLSNNNEKIFEALFKAIFMVHVCFHYYQYPFQYQVY